MTPLAGAKVCRVSVMVPYTTTSASAARSATVVWRHDARAGDDAKLMPNSTAANTGKRAKVLTSGRRRRWGRGSLRGLPGEQRAQPLAKRLQNGNGDERVLADHVVELATRQHETFHGR